MYSNTRYNSINMSNQLFGRKVKRSNKYKLARWENTAAIIMVITRGIKIRQKRFWRNVIFLPRLRIQYKSVRYYVLLQTVVENRKVHFRLNRLTFKHHYKIIT